jgi:hypothetical protein
MAGNDSPNESGLTNTGEADTSGAVTIDELTEPEICVADEPDDSVTCDGGRPQNSGTGKQKAGSGGSYFIDSRLVPRVIEVINRTLNIYSCSLLDLM